MADQDNAADPAGEPETQQNSDADGGGGGTVGAQYTCVRVDTGSDDAEEAAWVPIANLKRDAMFEDHYDILETMVPF